MGLTPEDFEAAALALAGAVLHVRPDRDRVYLVQGLSFAIRQDHVISGGASGWNSPSPSALLRCDPAMLARLTKIDGISEAPARIFPNGGWVRLKNLRVLPAEQLKECLAAAHALALEEAA